jgi:hypothetical protein
MAADAAATVTFVSTPPPPVLPADECAGIVPSALGPSLTRSVRFFGGPKRYCYDATSDGRGNVAGSESGMGPTAWTHFSADGEPLGDSRMERAVPQAEGFHSIDSAATAVLVWSGEGRLLRKTELGPPPVFPEVVYSTNLLLPAATGGSVAVRSNCYREGTGEPTLWLWRIDAAGNIVGKSELSGVNCASFFAVSDAQDRTLVTVSSSQLPNQERARWFDRTGTPLTEWFSFVSHPPDSGWVSPSLLIGGGVAWSGYGEWRVVLPSGLPRADTVPALPTSGHALRVVRGGRAYVHVPEFDVGGTLPLYAPSGKHCGSVQLPQRGYTFVGADGTVLQLSGDTGCELTWWPGLLK